MRRSLFALSTLGLLLAAPASEAHEADVSAIQEVVDAAYVQGIHNDRDPEKIRAGFHESFIMLIQTDEGIRQVTRDGWIERIEASKNRGDGKARPETTATITVLDHIGKAAVAKVDVFREGQQIFTDYMSLYKFEDGWKLVGKTFHSHR